MTHDACTLDVVAAATHVVPTRHPPAFLLGGALVSVSASASSSLAAAAAAAPVAAARDDPPTSNPPPHIVIVAAPSPSLASPTVTSLTTGTRTAVSASPGTSSSGSYGVGDAASAGAPHPRARRAASSSGVSDASVSDPSPTSRFGTSHRISADDTTCVAARPASRTPPATSAPNAHAPAAWRCAPTTVKTAPPFASLSDGRAARVIHVGVYSNPCAPRGETTARPRAASASAEEYSCASREDIVSPTAVNPPPGRPYGGVTHSILSPIGETACARTVCGPNWHAMFVVNPAPARETMEGRARVR